MRLIGYGPGEIVDRLSILLLKVSRRDLPHFREEYKKLRKLLPPEIPQAIVALAMTNSRLWYLEDQLRSYREAPEEHQDVLSGVACDIQRLNDRRAKLIASVNLVFGAEAPEEKL